MDTDLLFKIITTSAQGISFVSCLWLFYCYVNLNKKTLGLKMILILAASDFIFHSTMLVLTWTTQSWINVAGVTIVNIPLRFSIFWASSIAFLAYKSIRHEEICNPEKYLNKSLALSLSISIVLGIICDVFHHSNSSLIFTIVVPMTFSLGFTSIFYLKSVSLLKSYPNLSQESVKVTTRNLYMYSFIQLLTVGPTVAYYFLDALNDEKSDPFEAYVSLPLGFIGFVNSVVYFFQRRSTSKLVAKLMPSISTTNKTSFVQETSDDH